VSLLFHSFAKENGQVNRKGRRGAGRILSWLLGFIHPAWAAHVVSIKETKMCLSGIESRLQPAEESLQKARQLYDHFCEIWLPSR
jgi:hypothetical protein